METYYIGFIGLGLILILIAAGVPIAVSLGTVGIVGTMVLKGFSVGLELGSMVPFASVASYLLTIVPLFLLMGAFAFLSKISEDAYEIGNKWLSFLPGGLASATVAGCALFAATSGSSIATSGAMGKIAIGQMKKYGYDGKLACGCVAAGGLLGVMIPPSIILVLYGIITEESIGKLLMAGFLPGFLTAIVFIAGITLVVIKNPRLAPPANPVPWKERIYCLKSGVGILTLMAAALGTIYAGILTPTEAGAFGAFVAFIFVLIRNRDWKGFVASIKEASQVTSTIFAIIIGASIFAKFLVVAKVPLYVTHFIIGLDIAPIFILLTIFLVYIMLGCFLDPVSTLVLTLPLFYPVIIKLGFNGVWFGVIVTLLIEVGLITPPVGFNVYVIKSIVPEVPLEDVFLGVAFFIVMILLVLALLVTFPQIVLWLPNRFG